MNKSALNIIVAVLAVIGAVTILALLGMWLMHAGMMGSAGMMNCCGGMMGGWLIGLLLIVVIMIAVVLLFRRRTRL